MLSHILQGCLLLQRARAYNWSLVKSSEQTAPTWATWKPRRNTCRNSGAWQVRHVKQSCRSWWMLIMPNTWERLEPLIERCPWVVGPFQRGVFYGRGSLPWSVAPWLALRCKWRSLSLIKGWSTVVFSRLLIYPLRRRGQPRMTHRWGLV